MTVEPGPFHPAQAFAFCAVFERHWHEIHREFTGVRAELTDWFERELYGEGWKVYGLYDFPHGAPIQANVERCPLTAALVHTHVPRHGAAGFSLLAPGTRIRPHEGFQGEFLRLHLGLDIPPGDCGLRVGGETRAWANGRAMVFDDRVLHEAWNLTGRERVVLLVDFIPG
jgi:beta-hydroxylase